MSVVLAEAVQRAVGRVLTEANGQVEALIAAELDRQLAAIAQTVLAERLDLHAARHVDPVHEATKVCRTCGETKASDQFERGRRTCRECRRRQDRDRAARFSAVEADRPSVDPQPE